MPDLLGRLPFTVKALFACPVSPVGVNPYPAVMLVGFDSDPVMENGEPSAHSWFIGFTDWDGRKIAVSVIVEGENRGSRTATDVTAQILKAWK